MNSEYFTSEDLPSILKATKNNFGFVSKNNEARKQTGGIYYVTNKSTYGALCKVARIGRVQGVV